MTRRTQREHEFPSDMTRFVKDVTQNRGVRAEFPP